MQTITIATRKSPLALWQAEHVKSALEHLHDDLSVKLLPMSTRGDKILDSPLAKIGGKGLFVKELEQALFDGRADIAVHSMKDVPMDLPEGLTLGPILLREDPHDAFVSGHISSLEALPQNATVGSSSLRRICQLHRVRPDLNILSLRGNVNTRLAKLDAGAFEAIILASAGLKRLGLADRITHSISTSLCLPACGQGAMGIELREGDDAVAARIAPLNHSESAVCVLAERALNKRLNGGCQVPIAGFAELKDGNIHMRALVGSTDGKQMIELAGEAAAADAVALGVSLAEELLARGADKILAAIGHDVHG